MSREEVRGGCVLASEERKIIRKRRRKRIKKGRRKGRESYLCVCC